MKTFILSALCLIAANSFAYDYEAKYLEVGNGFYETVSGDGYEAGFQFTVTVYGKQKVGEALTYAVPAVKIQNDSADCFFGASISQTPVKKELAWTSSFNGTKNYKLTFQGEVQTSVNGDTGGCIATVFASKEEGADLLKVINYGYVTDY